MASTNFVDKLVQIYEWAQKIKKAGIILTGEPSSIRKYTKIETKTKYLGDPELNPRGIPYYTQKKVHVEDSVLKSLVDEGILDIDFEFDYYQEHKTAFASLTDLNLYFIPVLAYSKVQQPVLKMLNFDKSLVTPGDVGTMFKFYPLLRNGSYQAIALNLLFYKLINLLTVDELLWFIILTDPTYGQSIIMQYVKSYFKDNQQMQNNIKQALNYVPKLLQFSSLISWLHQVLKRQVAVNSSYESVIRVLANPALLEQLEEVQVEINNLQNLKAIVQNHPISVESMITDITYIEYLPGSNLYSHAESILSNENECYIPYIDSDEYRQNFTTTTNVITRSISMSSDGAYCQSSYESRPVITESLIKHLSLFKQTISTRLAKQEEFVGYLNGEGEWQNVTFKNVRIPTSNWNDAVSLGKFMVINQKSQTKWGVDSNAINVLTNILDEFYGDSSVVAANIQWDAVSGKFNENINRIGVSSN